MLVSGIVGHDGNFEAANLISSIIASAGRKTSVIDMKSLSGRDVRHVKTYISELAKNNVDFLIFKISLDDFNEFMPDQLRFDFIIFTGKHEAEDEHTDKDYRYAKEKLLSRLEEKGIAIMSIDDDDLAELCRRMKTCVLTYGFNSSASVTTSSIVDIAFKDSFMCCLQKTIPTAGGVVIEPQEYRLSVQPNEYSPYSILAAASFAIANGIDLSGLQHSN